MFHKIIGLVIFVITVAIPTMAQQWDKKQCGSDAANEVKNLISGLDPGDSQVVSKFEAITDLYWTNPTGDWCSPDGRLNTGWGGKGLSYFPLFSLQMEKWELDHMGVQFTDAQNEKFYAVQLDAAKALQNGSYYYYGPCNGYNHKVNYDDGCGEDLNSFFRFSVGILLSLPVVEQLGGKEVVEGLARKFFEQWLSSDFEHGGGLMVVGDDVCQPNHGGKCNEVYANIALSAAGDAVNVYRLLGENPPVWFRNQNALLLWQSLQKHIQPDGSAFTNDCVLNNGRVVGCNDPGPGWSNYLPAMVPGWRFVQAVWGDDEVMQGLRTLTCDQSLIGKIAESNFDIDRYNQNCLWNPAKIDMGLLTVPSQPSFIDVKWLAPKLADATSTYMPLSSRTKYDVLGPDGRAAQGLENDSFTFSGVPCGTPWKVTLLATGERGRVIGWSVDEAELECPRVRRHISH